MNRLLLSTVAAGIFMLGGLMPATASANGGRQYYGGWNNHPSGKYSYRSYYYKPTPSYVGYKHHYVIHHPSRPQYHYYYNPYTKKYWGRCPSSYGTKPVYSLLAEADRHGDLAQIQESKFPEPSPKLPPIPESTDGIPLDLPPDDLPDLDALPAITK
jgi:hypothetical protein